MSDFADRYGPWALIAGASDGVGAAFARAIAERGVNVVLLARRQAVLDEVAAGIRSDTGVEARTLVVDLARPDAVATVVDAVAGLDVGTLVYCAGADPSYEPFLDQPLDAHLSMVQRNCVVPMQLAHHLAPALVARGSGAIVLLSSGAALCGGPNVVTYAASKAFDLVLGEALWAELHDQGVDVLSLVLGATDTPALRRLLAQRGTPTGPDDTTPIPGLVSADQVVAEALANLANGPTWFVGDELRQSAQLLGGLPRSEAVTLMADYAGTGLMADHRGEAT